MLPKLKKKAYTIGDIPWIAITFGVGTMVLSIVGEIIGEVKDTQCTINSSTSECSTGTATLESNISTKGLSGIMKMANWLPTIGLVLGACIVIVALSVLFIFNKK